MNANDEEEAVKLAAINECKFWHEEIWTSATFVATSDGYLHILSKQKSDIPDRSYYMKVRNN